MMLWKKVIVLIATVGLLAACRLEITVTQGGEVVSDSGQHDCAGGPLDIRKTCTVEVTDTNFRETFTAVPAADYLFIGWQKGPSMLCGWAATGPCTLETSLFAESDVLMSILDSDTEFYLEPEFIKADEIRVYQAGDLAVFSGNMTMKRQNEPEQSYAVTVRKTYSPSASALPGQGVLTERTTITFRESGEEVVSEVDVRQDDKSDVYDVRDRYGNVYLTAGLDEEDLFSIPSALIPYSNKVVNFYTLFGGHTSGPVTQGVRSIHVSSDETITVPLGEYQVNKVSQEDSYEYISTYGDHKRGSSVVDNRQMWVSREKGVIQSIEVHSEYSSTGVLLTQRTLVLKAIRANY